MGGAIGTAPDADDIEALRREQAELQNNAIRQKEELKREQLARQGEEKGKGLQMLSELTGSGMRTPFKSEVLAEYLAAPTGTDNADESSPGKGAFGLPSASKHSMPPFEQPLPALKQSHDARPGLLRLDVVQKSPAPSGQQITG